MFFLLNQLRREIQGGANVLGGNAVVILHLFKRHAPRQPPDDASHRHARSTNDRLAMLNLRVDDDAIVHTSILRWMASKYQNTCRTHKDAAACGSRPLRS